MKKRMAVCMVIIMILSMSTVFAAWSPDITGEPSMDKHSHGYYIWKDTYGVHIRMLADGEPESFTGTVYTDGEFSGVLTRNMESGNVQVDDHKQLKFKVKGVRTAGIDFSVIDSDSVRFELYLNGKKISSKNINLGSEEWHPSDHVFTISREKQPAEYREETVAGNNSLEMSFNRFRYNYEESIGDSERGWLKGFHLTYKSQDPVTKEFWKVTYEQTNQNTHYDGALSDGTPYQGTTENKIVNSEYIYAVPITPEKRTFVYTGVGSHKWDRNLTGQYGYLEKYSWNYIPVGYRNEFKLGEKLSGAIDISARFMFNGNLKTSGGTYDPSEFTLGNKVGFRAEMPYTYKLSPNWSLAVTPWYEYSAIGESNTVFDTIGGSMVPVPGHIGYYYASQEPDSMNHQYGVNVGLTYTF
ncbi:MAG: hypothetical protein H6Q75_1316 [Firmicutes bacterium]|nr:hypothetical protein [Bacillota bacterium]